MEVGVVKFFDDTKKWGFIARENGADVFVHLTSLSEGLHTLVADQLVQFEIGPGPKKSPQAKNVSVVKDADPDEEEGY
jgi:CspA family cold shock protein